MKEETIKKIQLARKKSETLFTKRAMLQYEVARCNGLQATLVACIVAWFSLYLTEAIKSDKMIFVVLAGVGLIALTAVTIYYYLTGKTLSSEAARIEARIHINNTFNSDL